MNISIHSTSCQGPIEFSDETSHSRYGIPVLLVDGEGHGPRDFIAGTSTWAAEVVHGWAIQPGRTAEEMEVAGAYLRQWWDGSQLPE